MASYPPAQCCTVGVKHEGQPTGTIVKIDSKWDAYLALPEPSKAHKVGILYLPDVLGIWINSKLMADQFAANGYPCLVVDLFNGDALPLNRPPGFDVLKWRAEGSDGKNPHTPEFVDPIVEAAIRFLQGSDVGVEKIGAVGYCFGAKFVVRHYKSGISVGYIAHPSFVSEEELAAITGPLSIAAAETDRVFPPEKRHLSEEILAKTGLPYQVFLYSGVVHGFAVRCDLAKRAERFAKERAFLQAVAWFDEFLL